MDNKKFIVELHDASTLVGTEYVPIWQQNHTLKTTVNDFNFVKSVAGKIGVIELNINDIIDLSNTIDEQNNSISNISTSLNTKANVSHVHSYNSLTDKPSTFTPSTHSITSHYDLDSWKVVNKINYLSNVTSDIQTQLNNISGTDYAQSDWTQTNSNEKSYIKNKPTLGSIASYNVETFSLSTHNHNSTYVSLANSGASVANHESTYIHSNIHHTNRTILDNIISNGSSNQFLSADGSYRSITTTGFASTNHNHDSNYLSFASSSLFELVGTIVKNGNGSQYLSNDGNYKTLTVTGFASTNHNHDSNYLSFASSSLFELVGTIVKNGNGSQYLSNDGNYKTLTVTGFALENHTQNESTIIFSDNVSGNATSIKHGFLPKLSGNYLESLKGDGSWGLHSDITLQFIDSNGINNDIVLYNGYLPFYNSLGVQTNILLGDNHNNDFALATHNHNSTYLSLASSSLFEPIGTIVKNGNGDKFLSDDGNYTNINVTGFALSNHNHDSIYLSLTNSGDFLSDTVKLSKLVFRDPTTGTPDGTTGSDGTTTFTFTNNSIISDTEEIFVNGIRQDKNIQYTINQTTITFIAPYIPKTGDRISIKYILT